MRRASDGAGCNRGDWPRDPSTTGAAHSHAQFCKKHVLYHFLPVVLLETLYSPLTHPLSPRPNFSLPAPSLLQVHFMEFSELNIGPGRGARGSKAKIPVEIEVVRALDEGDLELLVNPPPVNAPAQAIQSLRATHHQLAQLLVRGTSESEASLITGYSLSRISILKSDPTFAELLSNYATKRELAFADTVDRMRVLGLSALDELQERLETSPEKWSNREVMEMAELMLVKPRLAAAASNGFGQPVTNSSPSGVTVNVKFVSSETPALVIEGKSEPR